MNAHIERLAREAGIKCCSVHPDDWFGGWEAELEAFARLIAEDCAKVIEEQGAAYSADTIRERYK